MNKKLVKDGFGWGFLLWLAGYALGFIFFFLVPPAIMGWFIMPLGIIMTVWVLMKKIKDTTLAYYVKLAVVWTVIAILFDYLFIVKTLKPADGYYKLDVYLYYVFTLILPLLVFYWKQKKVKS